MRSQRGIRLETRPFLRLNDVAAAVLVGTPAVQIGGATDCHTHVGSSTHHAGGQRANAGHLNVAAAVEHSTCLRPHPNEIVRSDTAVSLRFGDQAASLCWSRASYLLDYTYLTCPNRSTGSLRYRCGFRNMCALGSRMLPLYLDSGAYRESVKTAPTWSSYTRYRQAINLIQPDGAMARDVLNDQE